MEWWTPNYWSESYLQGRWDYLWRDEQKNRYNTILSLLNYCSSDKILDIGCGEGILLRSIQSIVQYKGIDFSEEAITSAKSIWRENENAFFEVKDAENLNINDWQQYDTIIFNEILYSLHDPLGLLYRIFQSRNSSNVKFIITSIYSEQKDLHHCIKAIFPGNVVRDVDATKTTGLGGWYLLLLEINK